MAKIDATKYSAQVANAASQVKISSTVFKAFIADVKDVVDQNSPEGRYAADAGATDTYAVTLAPVPTAYVTGAIYRFKANTANTGACTLNVNSLGAKTIKKNYNSDLSDNDIKANQIVEVTYDGTNFQLLSIPASVLVGEYAADSGVGDTYAITLDPAPTAYFTGMILRFKANTLNTGAATLNVNSLGAKAIVKNKDIALEDSDVKAGQIVTLVYDGTNFQLQSPSSLLNTNAGLMRQSIINSNFDLSRKDTSFTNPAALSMTLDNWKVTVVPDGGTDPTLIHSQQALTSGDIDKSFYHYRINANGAGSGYGLNSQYAIEQRVENGVRYLAGLGNQITISFYARSSIAGKKIGVFGVQNYGLGGSPSATESINGESWTLTTSWVKYTHTFTLNTIVGKTFGTSNDDYVMIRFYTLWGSTIATRVGAVGAETFVGSGNIDVAQVSCCVGSTALPYQPRSVGEEEELNDRFLKVFSDATLTEVPIGVGVALSTTQARIQVNLGNPMRTAPALTATAGDWKLSDGVTVTDVTAIAIETNQSSRRIVTLLVTVAAGLTQFRPYQLIADTTAGRKMIFDASVS